MWFYSVCRGRYLYRFFWRQTALRVLVPLDIDAQKQCFLHPSSPLISLLIGTWYVSKRPALELAARPRRVRRTFPDQILARPSLTLLNLSFSAACVP